MNVSAKSRHIIAFFGKNQASPQNQLPFWVVIYAFYKMKNTLEKL
jgi:hypothetical protein